MADNTSTNTTDCMDLCSKSKSESLNINNATESAKKIIDDIFKPLSGGDSRVYANAGYSNTSDVTTYETAYEIINLDPNNPYDIYYRDEDENLWQKNRNASTSTIEKNIQDIHDLIIERVRTRIKNMFGDNAVLKIEYCFMSKASLISHRLPEDHLFGKAKAVLVYIENERASLIYDDIVSWMEDEEEKEDEPKPEYGLLKLCNIENEKQRLYFTLKFTEQELKDDDLLIHNYSNFYYTETNDLRLLPDTGTSTKVFPSYQVDNDVEDLYSKKDDLEDEISKLDTKIQNATQQKDVTLVNKYKKEQLEKQQELNDIQNTDNSISDIDKKINNLKEIYDSLKTDETKEAYEKALDEKNFYPIKNDYGNATEELDKITNLENLLTIDLDISEDDKNYQLIKDYFDSRRMFLLKSTIDIIENSNIEYDEDYLKEELEYQKTIYQNNRTTIYNKIKQSRLSHLNDEEKLNFIEITDTDINAYKLRNSAFINFDEYTIRDINNESSFDFTITKNDNSEINLYDIIDNTKNNIDDNSLYINQKESFINIGKNIQDITFTFNKNLYENKSLTIQLDIYSNEMENNGKWLSLDSKNKNLNIRYTTENSSNLVSIYGDDIEENNYYREFSFNKWNTLFLIIDNGDIKIYKDNSYSNTISNFLDTEDMNTIIFNLSGSNKYRFNIYNRVLSQDEMNFNNIDPEPTIESIKEALEKNKITLLNKLKEMYDSKNLTNIHDYDLTLYSLTNRFKDMTYKEYIKCHLDELSKYPLLKELTSIVNVNYQNIDIEKPSIIDLGSIIKDKETYNINENFKYMLVDNSDYEDVMDYYYDLILNQKKDIDGIELDIAYSKEFTKICAKNSFSILIEPSTNTLEYAEFVKTYAIYSIQAFNNIKDDSNAEYIDKIIINLQDKITEIEKYIEEKSYNKIDSKSVKNTYYQFTTAEYSGSKPKMLKDYFNNKNNSLENRCIFYICYQVYLTILENQQLYWYLGLNDIGTNSIIPQMIVSECENLLKDKEAILKALFSDNDIVNVGIFPQSIDTSINKMKLYVYEEVDKLNDYISKYNAYRILLNYENINKYKKDIVATEDNIDSNSINIKLINIHKKFDEKEYNFNLIDYGNEYVTLQDNIYTLRYSSEQSSDNSYNILLKEDRLIKKRTYDYLSLNEVRKQIKNYKDEYDIAIKVNRIGRAQNILNNIIPELERLAELKENFVEVDDYSNEYELRRDAETSRLLYISNQNVTNVWYLYRYIINKTKTDYENKMGVFKDLDLDSDKMYILYLEELIKDVTNANNSVLNSELDALKKELLYLKNENNEKREKRKELFNEIEIKKANIETEINKRSKDKLYLHRVTRVNYLEENMKYRYKEFMYISNLPSEGVKYNFPFLLYNEFSSKYKEIIYSLNDDNMNNDIQDFELIDAYSNYCNDYKYYEFYFKQLSIENRNKWLKINYTLFTDNDIKDEYINKLIENVNKYKIKINMHKDYDFDEMITYSLRNIVGFIEYDTIPLDSEFNNEILSSVLHLKIRRNEDFIEDIKLFLNNLYEIEEKIFIENINIEKI